MKALITDVSRVLLFPKNKKYTGSLNSLYKEKVMNSNNLFFDFFQLNTELLDFYTSLSKKLDIHMVTSDVIQDAPELQPYWKGIIGNIFSASNIGLHKSESEMYKRILSELSVSASDVIFIDDNIVHIQAAQKIGLYGVVYTNNRQVIDAIHTIIDH